MPFVAAKCTQCGGVLDVDSAQEAAVCKFCKTPFVVEQAINNYNTTINIHESGVTADTLIGHADVLLKDGNFSKANEIYDKVLERAPHDHRAHWGKLLSALKFSDASDSEIEGYIKRNSNVINSYDDVRMFVNNFFRPHYDNAIQYAPEDKKSQYISFCGRFMSFAQAEKELLDKRNAVAPVIQQYKNEISSLNNSVNQLMGDRNKCEHEYANSGKKGYLVIAIALIILGFVSGSFDVLLFLAMIAVAIIIVSATSASHKKSKMSARISEIDNGLAQTHHEINELEERIRKITV